MNPVPLSSVKIIEAIRSKISAPIDFPLCRRFTEFRNKLREVAVFYARETKLRKVIQLTVIPPILGSMYYWGIQELGVGDNSATNDEDIGYNCR